MKNFIGLLTSFMLVSYTSITQATTTYSNNTSSSEGISQSYGGVRTAENGNLDTDISTPRTELESELVNNEEEGSSDTSVLDTCEIISEDIETDTENNSSLYGQTWVFRDRSNPNPSAIRFYPDGRLIMKRGYQRYIVNEGTYEVIDGQIGIYQPINITIFFPFENREIQTIYRIREEEGDLQVLEIAFQQSPRQQEVGDESRICIVDDTNLREFHRSLW